MPDPVSASGPVPVEDSPALDEVLRAVARAPPRDPGAVFASFAPGAVVGRFELLREVGRGGFGVVFEARDRELGRIVAFKAMRPSRAGPDVLAAPLHEEAEAAARLNHPNVVTLHDYGIHQGTPYLILEFLRGETLQERLRRGPLEAADAIRLALHMARGLSHAHEQGVLHRDLKPGNVFLTEGGGVKILDFGLARLLDHAALPGGTPAYMAPEQLRGEPGDARTDVFALAVVLFQALSGTLPYPPSGGKSSVLDPGPPPALPLEDAPGELSAFLAGALSKDPAGRPQSAAAVVAALSEVERALAGRAAQAARAARRRSARRILAAAAAVLLAVAYIVVVAALDARARAERALQASRVASAAEGAYDPLLGVLLMAELPDDPPPRAVEIAQRILAEPIPVAELELPPGGAGLAVSPDGSLLAAGAADGGAIVWRTDRSRPPAVFAGKGREASVVRFTPDGSRVVVAGWDGLVRVFAADGSEPSRSFSGSGAPLLTLAIDRTGRLAAAGGVDGRLWIFDITGRRVPRALVHDGAVLATAWSPDGSRLASGSADGLVRTFDAAGAPIARTDLRGGAVLALAWASDGRLAAAVEDGSTRILSAQGQALVEVDGGSPASSVEFDPAGTHLATAAADGTVRIYTVGSGGEQVVLRGHRGPVLTSAFLREGRRVLTVGVDGTARIWRTDGTGVPIVLRGRPVQEAALAPDSARVYTRGPEVVRVWDSDDPRERDVLRGHELEVTSVRWTRDGQRVLTAGHDGTARFWAVHGGEPLVMHDPGNTLHQADVDRAEKLLLTASEDGVVRVW
ncbi:MAG TPA: protein kinase, partial [Anaeromyxobacter sp.]|nr:protein kinase [Anaeromyxobacter sp.]